MTGADDPGGEEGVDAHAAAVGAGRRASALVSAGILLSRVSGLVRERAVGHFLGLTTDVANAYAYAFRIPNVLQNLLGEGVLSASFIPVHVALVDDGRTEDARRLASTVLGLLLAVAGTAATAMVLTAGPLAALLVPGKDAEFQRLVASLLRIVAPGLALLVVSAWCLGVLNSHRRFFLSYVAPVVWNAAQIVLLVGAGFVLLDDVTAPCGAVTDGCATPAAVFESLARALAWGTLVGGAVQVAVQLPVVRRLTPGLRPAVGPITPHVRSVLRAFVPVVAGRGVVQLATFVDLVLASLLAGAALATLQKVTILAVLPVSLFGMAIAAAELPELSGSASDAPSLARRRVDAGLERAAFFVAPTVVGFVVLGDVLVAGLFQSGAFQADDSRLVWVVLLGSAAGLLATTSSRLLQSVLYGRGDARTPARLAIVRVTIGTLLGLLLMFQLDRFELAGAGVGLAASAQLPALGPLPEVVRDTASLRLGALGLTIGASIGALVEYQLLRTLVEQRLGARVRIGGRSRGRLALSTLVALVAAVAIRPVATSLTPVLGGAVGVATVAAAHIGTALLLGVDEATAILDVVRRRVRRGG